MVGAVEPEVRPWLRATGSGARAAATPREARAAAAEQPVDLVIADKAPGRDVAAVCRALREIPDLQDAWILAITGAARGRTTDAALAAGADDYLQRPFTRGQLLARARIGLRSAQQRADDALMQALLVNVPGAIYRTAWHAGHAVELISDEIERISGYPPENFIASRRRTLLTIVHPDDLPRVERAVGDTDAHGSPLNLEYRILRADGEVRWVLDRGQLVRGADGKRWLDGALFDVTERRAAEEALRRREIEAARTEELRASRARIVEAADAARRKIERDLHDGAQQRLVALALQVRLAKARLEKHPGEAAPFLERMAGELGDASSELRELARGIHPAVLTERGLGPAIEALAARAPIPVEILDVPEDRLHPNTETTAYYTVAEALTNVAKYAQASHASVRLAVAGAELQVEVRDDGVGGARASTGSGLSGLADRVGAVDGTLAVESPPGEGTLIRAVLPVPMIASGV
jgi:PAS domain S-box-containing protein